MQLHSASQNINSQVGFRQLYVLSADIFILQVVGTNFHLVRAPFYCSCSMCVLSINM